MTYIKCNDCGKIYDSALEACLQCGCPTDQQQLPPTFNCDDNTPIDITSIFDIEEDKFEETKDIKIITREVLSSSIDEYCKSLQIDSPELLLHYHVEKGVGQLQVVYYDSFYELVDEIPNNEWVHKYGSPSKRMIINIDDKENIRLDLEKSKWIAHFPISQEIFLKCCYANKLEFKIIKENGSFVMVNGYYGFDPETGAEIDVNGDIVPENDLILNFQALYNYVIDPNMFKDALQRRQMLDDMLKKKIKELKDELMRKIKKKEQQNKRMGLVWLVVGILSFIIAIYVLIEDSLPSDDAIGDILIAFGISLLFVGGIFLAIYGGYRMEGLNSREALHKMVSK